MRFVVSAIHQGDYGSSVIFAAVESTRLGIQASVTWDPFVLCQIRLALTAIKRGGLIFGRPDGDHYHKTNAFAVACMLPWPLFLQSFYNTLYRSRRTRKSHIKKPKTKATINEKILICIQDALPSAYTFSFPFLFKGKLCYENESLFGPFLWVYLCR